MAAPISKLIGHLLVATPNLVDTHFSKSVVYVCEHDSEGVLGIMINKPLGIPLQRIFDQLGIEAESSAEKAGKRDVMMGGPVGTDHGFILYHNNEPQDSIRISNSPSLLNEIAQGNGPDEYLLSLGYAGWDPEQLLKEISRNDWVVVPASESSSRELIFDIPMKDRWKTAFRLLGYKPHAISSQVGHA